MERKEVQRSLWAHELNKKGADLSRKHLDQQVGGGGGQKRPGHQTERPAPPEEGAILGYGDADRIFQKGEMLTR